MSDDLVVTYEYESAGPDYIALEDAGVNLSLDDYKHSRRAILATLSSENVGYKIERDYTYMYKRNSRKYGAVRSATEKLIQL